MKNKSIETRKNQQNSMQLTLALMLQKAKRLHDNIKIALRITQVRERERESTLHNEEPTVFKTLH